MCVYARSIQSCPALPPYLQAPLSMGILQAGILEWVAVPSSRGSFQLRDQTRVSYVSCIGKQVLYHFPPLKKKEKNSCWFVKAIFPFISLPSMQLFCFVFNWTCSLHFSPSFLYPWPELSATTVKLLLLGSAITEMLKSHWRYSLNIKPYILELSCLCDKTGSPSSMLAIPSCGTDCWNSIISVCISSS